MPNKGIRRIEFKVWELPRPYHYAISVGSSLLMFGLHYLVSGALGDKNSFAFFGYAVGISAFCGGFLPGVVATFTSIGLGWYFFMPPTMSFKIASYSDVIGLIMASLMWTFISALCHLLRETAIRYKEAAWERDLNRDRLTRFYHNIGDSFCMLDQHQRISYANDSFVELAQLPLSEIVGRPLFEVFSLSDFKVDDSFVRSMENRQSYTGDVANAAGDSWYHLRAYPDDHGIAVYLQDVTLRKNIENRTSLLLEEERVARIKSDRTSRLKDEFIATLSHELRTPLTSILGWAELLTTRTKDAKVLEGLTAIERSTRSQAKLIEELLDMNRIASGKILLEFEFAPLEEIVMDAVSIVRHRIEEKGLTLHVDAPVDPMVVRIDPTRMQQVVFNLLENAVKFTPAGGSISVTMGTYQPATGPMLAELVVTDTGEGIEEDFIPHIFDRFRQANSSISRRHGGLGLGLAIVKQMVELQDGAVIVESEGRGKGSRFTVRLPLVPFVLPEEFGDNLVNGGIIGPALQSDLAGLRIAVVEDDESSRRVIQMMLTDSNAQVEVASSAEEGYELLKKMRPDVLVGDIGLPDIDGYEMIRTIRSWSDEQLRSIPAVALTAFVSSSDRLKAFEAGFDAHVSKPIDREVLKAAVLEVLQGRRTRVTTRP